MLTKLVCWSVLWLLLGFATKTCGLAQPASAAKVASSVAADELTGSQVLRLFRDPPRTNSTGPLWVWNDMLTDEQIRSTLRDLAKQKIQQVWVHPRPGLMTPYLGKEWFRLWETTLQEARKLDMNVWIYDENSYPSGFAGGWVPELMPESRGRGLGFSETNQVPQWQDSTIAVFRLNDSGDAEDVSAAIRGEAATPTGKFLVASELRAPNSPWHGNRSYVNLLSPGVTEKFLEVTLEPYRKQFGKEFGRRIPGVFTDEPNIRPAGGLPWSEVLASEFKKRWGYDLIPHLPSLVRTTGDWRKIRHNYYQVLHEQFVQHWAKPYYYYCETNNLQLTGHYWDHEWPNCEGVPDNMAMYAWFQLPAIDCLMNQYQENTHAQFGNIRMVKELSSVANQLGLKQTLCEIYGAGGWDLRFEDMKRIGDWLEVLGVNVLNQHLSYITIRGARKRDHPQSFSYHAPWWEDYHVSAQYFARMSAAMTQGQQVNPVLVLEPTTTAWMYQGDPQRLQQIGNAFFKLLMALEAAQIEYDLGSEDIIKHHGRAQDGKLVIGKRAYRRVVLPPFTENLNAGTQALLTNVAVIPLCGWVRVNGAVPEGGHAPAFDGWLSDVTNLVQSVVAELKEGLTAESTYVERAASDKGTLFHHRRALADGETLLLVNTSADYPASGVAISRYSAIEQWDPYSGDTRWHPFARLENGISAKFEIPPSGSLLLLFSHKAGPSHFPHETSRVYTNTGAVQVHRLEPNVLTLDYVDVTAAGETRSNQYFYAANQFVWNKNGMKQNPWDSAVQFKSELIDTRFPDNSGFEASYHFTIEDAVPYDLAFVLERPDLYTITLNGHLLRAGKSDWWLDKAFGRIPVANWARTGRNTIHIKARPFTIYHELEPAYLLGNFSLRPADSGFVLTKPQPLLLQKGAQPVLHGINPDHAMWLSKGISNVQTNSDYSPFVVLDLGKSRSLQSIAIWNYNENHVRNLTSRGARSVRITGAVSPGQFSQPLATVELLRGTGKSLDAQHVSLPTNYIRFVKFEILSNHAGVSFPPKEGAVEDSGYVGLAEVQFFEGAARGPIKGVRVTEVSSELPSHDRLASYLVDGSGLGIGRHGWNTQGHPFYSAGVSYTETFDLARKQGRYVVNMSDWLGSVARVKVNGKFVGHIDAPPWECDITERVKPGENIVEITIIGTPKNLLGPHHGSPVLGAAWPGNFQRGPIPGPPPGEEYSTVAYGLFKPFVIRQMRQTSATGDTAADDF